MTGEAMALYRAMAVGEGREELLEPLVRACCERLAARLRPGVLPADCGAAFPLAAAMLAADQLSGMPGDGGNIGGMTSFTAGDLTIRTEAGESGQSTGTLSRQALELMAPWMKDCGFVFMGVEG